MQHTLQHSLEIFIIKCERIILVGTRLLDGRVMRNAIKKSISHAKLKFILQMMLFIIHGIFVTSFKSQCS